MSHSNFRFLQAEWPELHAAASKAEALAYPDARTACFYARRALELAVHWLYRHDGALKLPYQDYLGALIHELSFRDTVGPALSAKMRLIKDLGNLAVHSAKPIRQIDALTAVRELFHVCFWLAHTYTRTAAGKPPAGLTFDQARLPQISPIPAQTLAQLQKQSEQLAEKDEKLAELLTGKAALDEELMRLRAEIAKAKKQNAAQPDTHDYSEAETRNYFIDLLLKEAGWPLDQERDREFPVTGMPTPTGEGFVDYVLWGDDGKPLALVEAKRTARDPCVGQQQAKLYADCLERQFGQRPVIFYSNGYEHWQWDDASYPPRPVQGFLKKDELELILQRRHTRLKLADAEINPAIVERYYQTRAIRRIAESFERDNCRKALVVMATGAGKTRTVIALADLLMRCNWVKRVLFLADRVALVNQAVNAFKAHLPSSSPVNLVTEKTIEGRVFVSTYPTMLRLIDDCRDGQRRFGVGHFDLVVIDEAHRSVYRKYGAIFDYFNALLVGLTATPKDEVDRNTYRLFELETGVPTDVYGIDEGVRDGFLAPPKAVSVPLKFQREGIRYDQLSEDERDQWDALEWNEDGEVPDRVEAEAVNQWLFNVDTVDKVLEHLMTRGQKVAELTEWNESGLRKSTAELLRAEVAAMNIDNFIVRPKRKLVEHYSSEDAWRNIEPEQQHELANEVAGLPSGRPDSDQAAKQFDWLILRLQLAMLRGEPSFTRLRDQVRDIADALAEKDSIPMVREQMALIQELQSEPFWENVTTPMLENVRKRLRTLAKLIEKAKRSLIYTDFKDEIGDGVPMELPVFNAAGDFERFRAKARQFLKAHDNHLAIHKLRLNQPLTRTDLDELERMLIEAGVGASDDLSRAKEESAGLGLFVRSLVGLDREAAKQAFAGFLAGKTPTANQIEFIDLIIDHLTQRGQMDPGLLYDSPFTDFNPMGVEGVFGEAAALELVSILDEIRQRAAA